MFSLNQTPGRTAFVDKKEYMFFSGYAYLGMNHHPEFINLVKEGMDLYGPLFPSSRISNTALELYNETEQLLTKRTQLTDTVLLPSGFTAGRAAVEWINNGSSLVKPQIFHSPSCHPAIRIGNNATLTFNEWAKKTVSYINSTDFDNIPVILSDSLNQLTAELYDFSFLKEIDKPIICIIDDSHGIGLIGSNGAGISAYLPKKENIEYIISYSLSKALNIPAGAVSCSSKPRANAIRSSHWYTAVTPPSPALLYAFGKSAPIYQNQLTQLKNKKEITGISSR